MFKFTLADGKVKECGVETLIYHGFDGYLYVKSLYPDGVLDGTFHIELPENMTRTVHNTELATGEDRRLCFLEDMRNHVVKIERNGGE